jgi:phosphate-selective porin OprO and OprP
MSSHLVPTIPVLFSLGTPGFSEQIGGIGRLAYQVLQEENYSFHLGADVEFLGRPTGLKTLTLADRPELRIDPTTILSTGGIANVADAQVYSGEAAAGSPFAKLINLRS